MHIEVSQHYDAPAAAVHDMLADPAFWQLSMRGEPQVESSQADAVTGGVVLRLKVTAPSQVARLVGDTLDMTLQATWLPDGDRWSGPVSIDVSKVPGSFSGLCTIAPAGGGTNVAYSGDFSIKLPLVGKTLEQKAAPYLTAVLKAQQATGIIWLADHQS